MFLTEKRMGMFCFHFLVLFDFSYYGIVHLFIFVSLGYLGCGIIADHSLFLS